ncbi:hypothetical protein GTW43_19210 [Streptomyces sp. SID5785]|uniref:hypothetical protein n=1 Tax=Streptomyces sp. SID5785 TaxID=2690309 RepID=UPI0013615DF9|nr:hypothetical protein [Streptomyces sp. SID5785]MZD07198.1 hypothetical protein [Streptomyces sp. SID5785]
MGITVGRSRRTVLVTATAALTLSGFALGVTRGATGSTAAGTAAPGTVVVQEDEHSKVLTADSSVRDKQQLVDEVHRQRREEQTRPTEPTPDPTDGGTSGGTTGGDTGGGDGGGHGDQNGFPVRDEWLDSSATGKATPAGGDRGRIAAAGASFVKVPFMEYYAIFTATSSDVSWLGERPFDADSIQHTDTWNVGSVGAPFLVIGAPKGADVKSTGASAEASWSTTVRDNWYSEHAHDQVAFYPPDQEDYSNVFRISHSVTGTFQFGSSFYTVTSRDRAYS